MIMATAYYSSRVMSLERALPLPIAGVIHLDLFELNLRAEDR